ncbi:hypothetical protein VSR17_00945 [Cupriavidus taiwanensis]|uniref:DUF5666 domain-containing protein n=1 Tax=Cupriavidus taiwanensis TaxID=164546 RepID=A0A375IFU0_9BURK|nr:hypothetical protein [Cupriavidus taiwanensis]SOY54518.1 conserved hypothetical protein; putative exported protein [Cupriavidus taiwanensis]SOY55259.1 conserved hypothetical protein; putative exported protein [Cupriavidus taiwanensis]SOY89340.1 conserved hypothetical protein; putative exported protein [Cupriavidus taiwanensis]SOZ24905.1 conserved hypothetical protein; putative exported protein [Cupriavidus taiwanensis]SOZ61540.1 conserved hypothetical protein; putative exported protein [Cup
MIRQCSSLLAALLALAAFSAGSANAQRPPGPVGVAEEAVISGKIVDIDPETKAVLVQGPRGNVVELVGGDEARNFGQIRKGDILTVARGAALVAALEPVDSKTTALAETVDRTTRAAEGGKPGIMREITTTVTAQITKIDPAKRQLTFRGPRETLRTVKVQDPAIDLNGIKQGQMAKIVYREVVAITVRAPAAAAAH